MVDNLASVRLIRPSAMALHVWLVYTVAALGLSLSPGPNSLLALTHGALHGRQKALYTLVGGSLGFLLIILCPCSA